MLNETQEIEIQEIYQDYQNDIKPLVYYIERRFRKFPLSLLNEIRDVFDHISRCYKTDVGEEYINDNIAKAKNHFDRVKLDSYKYVNDVKRKDFTRWKRKYDKYDLQNINDGEFWKSIIDLEDEAESIFADAKREESIDINHSYELFYESASKYSEIDELIKEKREYIVKAKFRYRRVTFSNQLLGFVVGIVSSIIASIIYTDCFGVIKSWLLNLLS